MRIVLTALFSLLLAPLVDLLFLPIRSLPVIDAGLARPPQRFGSYLTRVTDVFAEPPALEVTVTLVG